jgi:hypothetical protein
MQVCSDLRPVRDRLAKRNRARDAKFHKILIELYPSEKFAGYSMPNYKRGYNSVECLSGGPRKEATHSTVGHTVASGSVHF